MKTFGRVIGKALKMIAIGLSIGLGLNFLGMVGLFVSYALQPTPSLMQYINKRWNLDYPLPEEAVCEYKNADLGLSGDGTRYCIFSFEENPDEFLTAFHQEKNIEFEEEFTSLAKNLKNEQEVPSKQMPDWTESYIWKYKWQIVNGDEGYNFPAPTKERHLFIERLCMVYFPHNNQLYTCEFLW